MSRENKSGLAPHSRAGRWRRGHRRGDTGSRGGSNLALRALRSLLPGTSTDQTGSSWGEECHPHHHHHYHHHNHHHHLEVRLKCFAESFDRSFGCLIDDEGCCEIIEGIFSIVSVLLDGVDGEPGKGVVGGRLLHLANRSQSESLSFSADQTQAKLQVHVYMEWFQCVETQHLQGGRWNFLQRTCKLAPRLQQSRVRLQQGRCWG